MSIERFDFIYTLTVYLFFKILIQRTSYSDGCAGKNLSMLPVEPKLGKMLILGSIFNCVDPVMTIVAGLSVRDPFLMPFDKKDVSALKCPLHKLFCSFLL